jgi:phage shock protein A
MSDLFKKLNTLVRASINDAVDTGTAGLRQRINRPKDVERQIDDLRQRINDAIDYEDSLQQRSAALKADIAELDRQADEALLQGNEALARHLIQQMQRAQQRQTMAEADLRAHQLVAHELIQKVNLLEATLADVRRVQESKQPDDASATPHQDSAVEVLGGLLKDAREKIKKPGADHDSPPPASLQDDAPVDEAAVDDDLSARRNRLSRR